MSLFTKVSGLGILKDAFGGGNNNSEGNQGQSPEYANAVNNAGLAAQQPAAPATPYVAPQYTLQNRDPTAAPTDSITKEQYDQGLLDSVNSFADPNNVLNQRAKQAGLAQANERGLLNSSMAVGAAQNQVLDRATDLGKQSYQGWLGGQQQANQAKYNNWAAGEAYNRDYVGTLAALPIKNYYDSMDALMQAAIQDPTLMSPDAMSGFSNFFQAMNTDMMNNYKYENGKSIAGQVSGGG